MYDLWHLFSNEMYIGKLYLLIIFSNNIPLLLSLLLPPSVSLSLSLAGSVSCFAMPEKVGGFIQDEIYVKSNDKFYRVRMTCQQRKRKLMNQLRRETCSRTHLGMVILTIRIYKIKIRPNGIG